jgi:hypothetical protein
MNSNQIECNKTLSPSSLSSASSLSTSPSASALLSIPYKKYNIDNSDKISNITNCYIPQYTPKTLNNSVKSDMTSNEKLYLQEIESKKQLENENITNNLIQSSAPVNFELLKAGLDESIKFENSKSNILDHQASFYDYLMNTPYRNFNFNDVSSKKPFNIESLVMNNDFRNNKTQNFNNFLKDSIIDKNNKFNETSISILDQAKLAYIMNNSINDADNNFNMSTLPLNSQIIDYVQIYQNSLGLNR